MNELDQHAVERLRYAFQVTRRDLFKFMGAGLVVGICVPAALAQESGRPASASEAPPQELESWLHIAGDGKVTVFTGKVEMGQNIRTSLAQQVAEELRTPLASITMVMGDTELTPFDLGTFGSRTTPQMGSQLRKVAAVARELLLDMAAQHWHIDRPLLVAENGGIGNSRSNEKISYGELTGGQKIVKVVSADAATTPPAQWHIAGTPAPKVDGRAFVTGTHQYTSDITRPGMLHGKVLRPNAFNATLASLDSALAEKLGNVKVVHDGNFVGVAAASPEAADNALQLLQAQWNAPAQVSEGELFHELQSNTNSNAGDFGGRDNPALGDVDKALSDLKLTSKQTYTVAYIAHAPLEPRAAVAEWNGDKLTVWTGTQRPFGVRDELAETFRIPTTRVRVIMPDMGSGYGGQHTGECAIEAARLAKAAGKPVKVVWTREEEFTWAYFRPAGVIEVRGGVKEDGTLVAWECHNYNSGPSALGTPYTVPNQRSAFHPSHSPLRQGSYRG